MSTLSLALLQYRVGRPGSFAAWAEALDARIGVAARHGAELLVLPEYAAVDAAALAVPAPDLPRELAAVLDRNAALLDAMAGAAMRHGVWLLGGSLPVRAGGRVINRATLFAPDGRRAAQDKHVMTRFENELWQVSPGAPPAVFETPWGRLGIAICYDVEFPPLVRAQVEAGAWLILVPSCTDSVAGFNRVRLSARARALENQCYVAVAPTVGDAPWLGTLDENHGYAAVFGPVDHGFPEDGVLARGTADGADEWVYASLDRARLDAVRREGGVLNHRDWPELPPLCPLRVPA